MKNSFEPIPLRKDLLAWSRTATAAKALQTAVQQANIPAATQDALPLPPAMDGHPALDRCEWALQHLAAERQAAADAHEVQTRAARWKSALEKIRAEQKAAESARARKRALKLLAAAAVLVVIAGVAAMTWWNRRPPTVSRSEVEQRITRVLKERGYSIAALDYQVGRFYNGAAPIQAMVTASLDGPLFIAVPADSYLQSELKLDPKISKRIAELSAPKGLPRVLELAGLAGTPFDASKVTLLKVASPAGATVNASAYLSATRPSGSWVLSDAAVNLPVLRPDAKPRQGFSGTVFELDREEDKTRLRGLVDEQANIAMKLERAREAYAAEIMAQHRKEEGVLTGLYRPGAVFSGTVAGRTPAERKSIYLELTQAGAATGGGVHPVKALFHNDGGWGDGRVFEGSWKFDPGLERFQLSLASGTDQLVRAGGPILGEPRLVKLELAMDSERLSGELDTTACQLTRVADADVDRIKREASPDYFGLLDIVAPGSIYAGTIKMPAGTNEQVYLQFTRADNGGAVVEALVLDPDQDSWRFKVTGSIIGNRYREGQWPLRLAVVRTALSPGIPAKAFIMQFGAVALRLENGRLISDYRGQAFHFDRVSKEETVRRLQNASARRRTFESAIRQGNILDGFTVNPQKNVRSPVRLRVTTINPADGSIALRLDSGTIPGVYRNLVGKVFEDANSLNLTFDMRAGEWNVDRRAVEPFFKSGRDSLILNLEGTALTGQDGHQWTFEFPAR